MFSTSFASSIVDIFGGNVYIAPITSCYIGLSTTTPDTDGSNFTEPSSAYAYARVLLGQRSSSASTYNPHYMVASGSAGVGTLQNDRIIYFNEATGSWGTITHFGLFTSASATTPFIYGALQSSVTILANYVPMFRAGNLVITLS